MYDAFKMQKDIREGELSFIQIAVKYNVSILDVEDVLSEMISNEREYEPDCDDGDDGYALASAGFGTDEDYGFCDEF